VTYDWKMIAVLVAAILITVLRSTVPGHGLSYAGSYEAVAHLFVGGLLGAWLVNRDHNLLWIVGAMSLIETVAFLLRDKGAS